jgi:small-conductance mechanosensitive channel
VVIPNADLFTHSVIVHTALDTRRWEYDISVPKTGGLEDLKAHIISIVQGAPQVLSDPAPEALLDRYGWRQCKDPSPLVDKGASPA